MPRSAGLETLAEVVGWIRKKRLPVTFPFEYRTVAADDIWMSPMNAGPVAAISMHPYARMPWRTLFADAEAIFRGAGGRPHWAKRHTLSRADVATHYPMASRYIAVRRAVDPHGKFLNPHLEIGRASCRERVCQYVLISVVAVSLKKKKKQTYQLKL